MTNSNYFVSFFSWIGSTIKEELSLFFFHFFSEPKRKDLMQTESKYIPLLSAGKDALFYVFKRFFIWNVIVQYVFIVAPVISGSMSPVLLTKDYVMLSTSMYQIGGNKSYKNQEIKRGDVIAFTHNSLPEGAVYMKRILAIEGDSIQFINDMIVLNNVPLRTEFIKKDFYIEDDIKHNNYVYKVWIPIEKNIDPKNGEFVESLVCLKQDIGNFNSTSTTEAFHIPSGHFFPVGVNFQRSADGRSLLGIVPMESIIGKAIFILISNPYIFDINPIKFITGFDISRFVKQIK